MTRQAANYEILNKLYAIVEKHPDWRFHQILRSLGITLRDETKTGWERMYFDQFFEESDDTLERMLDI